MLAHKKIKKPLDFDNIDIDQLWDEDFHSILSLVDPLASRSIVEDKVYSLPTPIICEVPKPTKTRTVNFDLAKNTNSAIKKIEYFKPDFELDQVKLSSKEKSLLNCLEELTEDDLKQLGIFFGLKTTNSSKLRKYLLEMKEWIENDRVSRNYLSTFSSEILAKFKRQ